jgi:hypothetical protein
MYHAQSVDLVVTSFLLNHEICNLLPLLVSVTFVDSIIEQLKLTFEEILSHILDDGGSYVFS